MEGAIAAIKEMKAQGTKVINNKSTMTYEIIGGYEPHHGSILLKYTI